MRKLKITKFLNANIIRRTDDKYNQEVFEIDPDGNEALITCWSSYLEKGLIESEANAQLIADAFNTANKCDMLPGELLELLKECSYVFKNQHLLQSSVVQKSNVIKDKVKNLFDNE